MPALASEEGAIEVVGFFLGITLVGISNSFAAAFWNARPIIADKPTFYLGSAVVTSATSGIALYSIWVLFSHRGISNLNEGLYRTRLSALDFSARRDAASMAAFISAWASAFRSSTRPI